MGKGTAVGLGCEASLACARPGNGFAEALLVRSALGPHRSPYACGGAIGCRLRAPAADHCFLINDGPATAVRLDTRDYCYGKATDAITGDALPLAQPISLPAYGGRWLRLEK